MANPSGTQTILVVDDSPLIRRMIRKDLEDGGYRVVEAEDGISALVCLSKSGVPDMITLDVEMPRLDGFETCKKIQSAVAKIFSGAAASPHIPVVFITSKDNLDDRRKGFDLGAADFIPKPFEEGDVLEAVHKILNPQKRLTRSRALVVDDSAVTRQIVQNCLSSEGLSVEVAADGDEAFNRICNRSPAIDIIITDYEMPNMPGIELCRKVRNELNIKETPILFLTALNDVANVLDIFKAGATDYIVKPFVKEEFVARVMAHLERGLLSKKLQHTIVELKESNKMKDNLNQLKNKFLGMAAHDLRSPLASIRGLSEILLMDHSGILNDEQTEYIAMMHTTSNQMLSLVNDLLDVSVIESGKLELKKERCNFKEIIMQRVKLFELSARQKNMLIATTGLADVFAVMDSNRIAQAVDNFIGNAIKYSPAGTTIDVSFEQGETFFKVSVRDEGQGISEQEQQKLFGDFQKLSSKTTGGENSTGLGLSIVKKIIEAHNGGVGVESAIGKGAVFYFTIPKGDLHNG